MPTSPDTSCTVSGAQRRRSATVFGAASRARLTLKNLSSVSLGRCALDGAYRLATALECATERAEAQQRQVDQVPRQADAAARRALDLRVAWGARSSWHMLAGHGCRMHNSAPSQRHAAEIDLGPRTKPGGANRAGASFRANRRDGDVKSHSLAIGAKSGQKGTFRPSQAAKSAPHKQSLGVVTSAVSGVDCFYVESTRLSNAPYPNTNRRAPPKPLSAQKRLRVVRPKRCAISVALCEMCVSVMSHDEHTRHPRPNRQHTREKQKKPLHFSFSLHVDHVRRRCCMRSVFI